MCNLMNGFAMITYTISNTARTLAAIGFTSSQLGRAKGMFITVMTNDVNVSFVPATAPTTTTGHTLAKNQHYILSLLNINDFQIIRSGSADATITITLTD